MRQWREIAGRPDTALGWHQGCDAALEHPAQALGDRGADPGITFCQHVGADQHHGPHLGARQGIARAGGMRSHHVSLQLLEIGGRHPHIGQQAHAGVHAVDGLAARRKLLHNHARA